MTWLASASSSSASTSAHARIRQVEVVLQGRTQLGAPLPAARDRVAALAQFADVALWPVGPLAEERPDAVLEGHRVDARDAARVEVVLLEPAVRSGRADDADPVGELGPIDGRALDQEAASLEPLERRPPLRLDAGNVSLPLADQDVEALQRATGVRCHRSSSPFQVPTNET